MTQLNQEFKDYLAGKIKIDKICDMLVQDIHNDNKDLFKDKWNLFREKFTNLEVLNINKVWNALIANEKTHWFEKEDLPFNKTCHAVMYAAQNYYIDNNNYNKDILIMCYKEMLAVSKSSVLKDFEGLRLYWANSFYESDEKKCEKSLSVIMEIDDLYREVKSQNPDKFLTYMIITQGKEIQSKNMMGNSHTGLSENNFFKTVTIKLMDRLIQVDGIGANKLNNKKDSQSLNELYHYFQKYYQYVKLDRMFSKYPEKNIQVKKSKI